MPETAVTQTEQEEPKEQALTGHSAVLRRAALAEELKLGHAFNIEQGLLRQQLLAEVRDLADALRSSIAAKEAS